MQTFLPYPNFVESVRVLDNKRLGKQRVEAYQILKVLRGESKGWRNHPAVKMWEGYQLSLGEYMNACIDEWVKRGFKNTMGRFYGPTSHTRPPWIGDNAFHASHRSNLLRKDSKWYGQYGWTESNDLPYVWPSKERK